MRENAPLVIAVAVGAALTLPFLAARSFWQDEALSFRLARLAWDEFAETVTERENNMVLYHLLLRGWTEVGTSEAFVRGLSALAGLAALLVFYALVRRLFGRRVAVGGSILLAANPLFVQYSREARGYALCLALVTAASYLFVRGLDRPTSAVWIAYGVVAALAVYAHLFAVLVPPAHAASLLFRTERRLPWKHLLVAALVFGAGLVPFVALSAATETSGIEWAAGNSIGRVFVSLEERVPVAAGLTFVAVAGAAALYLALRFRRSRFARRRDVWPLAFVLAWLLVPIAAVVLISYVSTPVFVIRYFIIVLPPAVCLVALLLARVARPILYAGAVVLAAAASAAVTLTWSASAEEPWNDATRYVAANAQNGDGVLFFAPYARVPFEVYLERMPRAQATIRPVYPATAWDQDLLSVIENVPVTQPAIRRASAGFDRIWLVLSHEEFEPSTKYEALLAGLGSFRRSNSRDFPNITVVRYERRPDS